MKEDYFYSWSLKYLLSSIYALIIIILLVKKKKFNVKSMIITIILFIILEHGTAILIPVVNENGFVGFIGNVLVKAIAQARIFSGTYFMIICALLSILDLYFKRLDLRIYGFSFIYLFIFSAFNIIPYSELIMYVVFFKCVIRCKSNGKNGLF